MGEEKRGTDLGLAVGGWVEDVSYELDPAFSHSFGSRVLRQSGLAKSIIFAHGWIFGSPEDMGSLLMKCWLGLDTA